MNPSKISQEPTEVLPASNSQKEDKKLESQAALRARHNQASQNSYVRKADLNHIKDQLTENPFPWSLTSKEDPQTNEMKEIIELNFAKTEKQKRRPLVDISDLTNVKKRLFDDERLTGTQKKNGMSQISKGKQIEIFKNIPKESHNTSPGNEKPCHSLKRKTREFEKFDSKLYVHAKRGKMSKPFQEDIILFDITNKRELKFRLFRDKDLRISSYHQRIVHESKLDDDCPTDSQQLEIACSHVKEELEEAIEAQKEKLSGSFSTSSMSSFEESLSTSLKPEVSDNTFTTDGYFPNDYKPSN